MQVKKPAKKNATLFLQGVCKFFLVWVKWHYRHSFINSSDSFQDSCFSLNP